MKRFKIDESQTSAKGRKKVSITNLVKGIKKGAKNKTQKKDGPRVSNEGTDFDSML